MSFDFSNWQIVQPDKIILDNPLIFIGCMTGTSADTYADFTLAVFDSDNMPIAFLNVAEQIDTSLRFELSRLSASNADTITIDKRAQVETRFTNFLASAFKNVIQIASLINYPKDKIVLSPHGQTISHKPLGTYPYTDILLNADILAIKTGYKVIARHRQMALHVSMGAPLAPILIEKLFHSSNKNRIFVNGGGIANIAALLKSKPNEIVGYDIGPANGPLNSYIAYILDNKDSSIPHNLIEKIEAERFDVDGGFSSIGNVNATLLANLLGHEYFKRDVNQKSADRADFNLSWILNQPNIEKITPADVMATISELVALTIAEAIIAAALKDHQATHTEIIIYGGLINNKHVVSRILAHINKSTIKNYSVIPMSDLGYDPEHFESLLMAYLGLLVFKNTPINLNYCVRPNMSSYAIPGTLINPVIS